MVFTILLTNIVASQIYKLDYILNPAKTIANNVVSSHLRQRLTDDSSKK